MPGTGLGITTGKPAFSAGRRSFITLKERRTRSTESPAVQSGPLDGVSQSLPAVPQVESTRIFQKHLPAPFIACTECMACLSVEINPCFTAVDKGHSLTFCFTAKLPSPKFSLCKAVAIRQSRHHEVRAFSSILDSAAGRNTESARSSLWLCLCMCWHSSTQSHPSNTSIFFTLTDPVWTHFPHAKRVAVGVMLVMNCASLAAEGRTVPSELEQALCQLPADD